MSTAVLSKNLTNRLELSSVADTALKVATRFWFGVTVIGPSPTNSSIAA